MMKHKYQFFTSIGVRFLLCIVFAAGIGMSASLSGYAQNNAGLGTTNPDPSALLDMTSTTQGFLAPRMDLAARNAIANPATGLVIYNTDDNAFEYNSGTPGTPVWVALVTLPSLVGSTWQITGNSGTNPASNFIGTTDAQPLIFRTNNAEAARILANGNFGIGGANPLAAFSVGPASEFQVSLGGAITSATGIVSSGDIDFSALNSGGLVRASAGVGRLSVATAGTDYENPLSFANGLTRTGDAVSLGGTLTTATIIANSGFAFGITGAGNVGIGTAAPASKFSVGPGSEFQVNNSGAITAATGIVSSGAIDFSSLAAGGIVQAAPGTGRLSIGVAGFENPLTFGNGLTRTGDAVSLGGTLTTATVIASAGNNLEFSGAGNVGIGVSPLQKLDVNGAIRIGSTALATAGTIRWTGTDFEGYDGSSWLSLTPSGGGGGLGNAWTVTGNTVGGGDFLGSINNADVVFRSNNVERMRISAGGSVGVGVVSPAQSLDVVGGLKIGNTAVSTAGSVRWTGTDFEGYDGSSWLSLTASGGSGSGWSITGNTIGASDFLGGTNSESLRFRTDDVERMRITASGNVVIGATSTSRRFEVVGTMKFGQDGTTVTNIIKNSVVLDVPSIGASSALALSFVITGAATGSAVNISPSNALADGIIISYARVSAVNTVEVKFFNATGGAIDPPSQTYYLTIIE